MLASEDELLTYIADLIKKIERYGATVLPPNDGEEAELGREPDGSLVVDVECRLQAPSRRSANVDLTIFERWRAVSDRRYERVDYLYELLNHEQQYRRAFHRHDWERFVRVYDVATHEHCEATLGIAECDHYSGEPIPSGLLGIEALYDVWLLGSKPECSALHCLG